MRKLAAILLFATALTAGCGGVNFSAEGAVKDSPISWIMAAKYVQRNHDKSAEEKLIAKAEQISKRAKITLHEGLSESEDVSGLSYESTRISSDASRTIVRFLLAEKYDVEATFVGPTKKWLFLDLAKRPYPVSLKLSKDGTNFGTHSADEFFAKLIVERDAVSLTEKKWAAYSARIEREAAEEAKRKAEEAKRLAEAKAFEEKMEQQKLLTERVERVSTEMAEKFMATQYVPTPNRPDWAEKLYRASIQSQAKHAYRNNLEFGHRIPREFQLAE